MGEVWEMRGNGRRRRWLFQNRGGEELTRGRGKT
jgi:hypothetical protein